MWTSNRLVSSSLRKAGVALSMAIASILSLQAQSTVQPASSSADYRFLLSSDELGGLAPTPTVAGQYGGGYGAGQPMRRSRFSHLAVEGGGGFTAPVDSTSKEQTYGWNFRGGAGWNFSKRFALLGEYEFNRTGIPSNILQQVGEPGGNVHLWSLTLDPVFNYKTGGRWGGYVTGGGGFYRKLTSFTEPINAEGLYCDYFYCYPYYYTANVVVSHYSSNQGGVNIGTGFTFGSWNHARFYTEARYEWLNTPGRSTQVIPVTFGLRW